MDNVVKLAKYIKELKYEDLPQKTIDNTKRLFLDMYGCMIAGSSTDAVPELVEMVDDWGGKEESSLFMYGNKLPAPYAGLVNTVMSHARDFDDTHDPAVLHTSVVVIPACLAAAQIAEEHGHKVDGKELIAAIVGGIDVHCKLSKSFTLSVPQSGFTYTALCGYFAAAAAAAKLIGLDEEGIINAIGLVYTQAGGTNQAAMDAVLAKRCQPGLATMGGIISAVMASKGITGVKNVFDGKNGFYYTYMKGNCKPEIFFDTLGKEYEVDALSYKPFPCCRFNHAAITLTRKMMADYDIRPEEILAVDIETTAGTYKTICEPLEMRRNPDSPVCAQFSLPFTVSCQLGTGSVALENFTQEGIYDKRIRDIIGKVTPVVSEELEEKYGRGCGAVRITIKTTRGTFTDFGEEAKGSPTNPMSIEDIEEKVHSCAKFSALPVDTDALNSAISTIEALEGTDSVENLMQILNSPFKKG